jgi:gliding motility-associated-like protein
VEGLESVWDGVYLKVSGLSAGEFNLYILDGKGCSIPVKGNVMGAIPMTVKFVEESQSCPGGNFGRLGVAVVGGKPPYRYSWDLDGGVAITGTVKNAELGKNFISEVPSGQYRVTVIDQAGCEITAYGVITELVPQVRMPTGYLPSSGLYGPVSNCTITFSVKIFDRWGQLTYSGGEGWNGRIREIEAPTGTYTYTISYSYRKEGDIATEEKSGIFTLIR